MHTWQLILAGTVAIAALLHAWSSEVQVHLMSWSHYSGPCCELGLRLERLSGNPADPTCEFIPLGQRSLTVLGIGLLFITVRYLRWGPIPKA